MSTSHRSSLDTLFAKSPPVDLKTQFADFACVALILRERDGELEIAFIRRAQNPNDPWSGHVAFPGGRAEPTDPTDLASALRETLEETGWCLSENHFLGFLTDLQARSRGGVLQFFLRPLAFFSSEEFPLDAFDPSEVEEVFWVSIDHLRDPRNQTTIEVPLRGGELPATRMPQGGTLLWGLTYMITRELLAKLEKRTTAEKP